MSTVPSLTAGEDGFAVRVMPSDAPPSLELRLPGPGEPADLVDGARCLDLLRGGEVWRAATPLTMLAGLRDSVAVEQLLETLDVAWLDDLRIRLDADHPITDHPITTRPGTRFPISRRRRALRPRDRTLDILYELSRLYACPQRDRSEFTACAAEAANRALRRPPVAEHPETATALHWMVSLAGAFPGEPMVLAPLLFALRRFEADLAFLVPARWPVALLSGDAVGVCGVGSVVVTADLGTGDPDLPGFLSAMESGPEGGGPEPDGETVARALEIARETVAPTNVRPARHAMPPAAPPVARQAGTRRPSSPHRPRAVPRKT